jgi:hypothetical protein
MFIHAHFAAGLLVGKLTGSYPAALAGSLLIDIDHLIPYYKYKLLTNLKKFWAASTVLNKKIMYTRNYLHSVYSFVLFSTLFYIFDPALGLAFGMGYAGHLILDALDNAKYYPFYPSHWQFKGLIPYYSFYEWIIAAFLLGIFFLL